MKLTIFLSLAILAATILGHPEPDHELSASEIAKRELDAHHRAWKARNCEREIRAFSATRVAKREVNLGRRQEPSGTADAPPAHITEIPENATCIVAPEVIEGPYYINNELIRTNLSETQSGVLLALDVGVMDIHTCAPISDAFVELWAANATGIYSGYPTGTPDYVKTETFGRGGYPTNDEGIVEITTVYPGYYFGRTAHIHVMVHLNYSSNADGTIQSTSGSVVHLGQLYFDDDWNTKVYGDAPYTENKMNRTLNSDDWFVKPAGSNGYNSFVSLSYLNGNSFAGGLLGYITVGVDTSAHYAIDNKNFYGGSGI